MLGRQASILLLMLSCLSLGAQGASGLVAPKAKPQPVVKAKPAKLVVKQVRQKDGSVVMRLDIAPKLAEAAVNQPSAGIPPKAAQNQLLMDQWLDAVTEPRFMTALAAVAMEPGADARAIPGNVDPTTVRNWAEFIDPDLFLRWQAAQIEARFGLAIHNRSGGQGLLPGWTPFPVEFPVPAEFRAGNPLPPTLWSRGLEAGGVQEATREWLKIPVQDPRANVWLQAGQNYRY